jgi:chromosome segregation ATPase
LLFIEIGLEVVNHNLGFPSRGWMGRWLAAFMNGATADRLDRLERQVQIYQQENLALKQQRNEDQAQFNALAEQVVQLEQQCVQFLLQPQDKRLGEVDRQLSRVWQYHQDAKVQFEKLNRQMLQQKTTSEEATQKFRQQISKTNALHRTEIRDLKQQLDQLAFSSQTNRQRQDAEPDVEPLS